MRFHRRPEQIITGPQWVRDTFRSFWGTFFFLLSPQCFFYTGMRFDSRKGAIRPRFDVHLQLHVWPPTAILTPENVVVRAARETGRWPGSLRTWAPICIPTRLPQAATTACTSRRSRRPCRCPRPRTVTTTTASSRATAPDLPSASSAPTNTTAAPPTRCPIAPSRTSWASARLTAPTARTVPIHLQHRSIQVN